MADSEAQPKPEVEQTLEDGEKQAEQEEAFLKKWAGACLIGPFFPAVFATFIVVAGGIVLNTWTGQCGYPLDSKCFHYSTNYSL